jgi:hypothetical protein
MSWKLIRSIQKKETDLRLIMPFGLNLRLGDVISVAKNGEFTLEGTANSILGPGLVSTRTQQPAKVNLYNQSGSKTQVQFRAAGTASGLFQGLPTADAGVDISFGSADEWVLALTGRSLTSLQNINNFRRPILDAYRWEVWKPDWALVTSIATVDKMTLLASRTSKTKVALSLTAPAVPNAPVEVKLTAGATIVATSAQITQCITSDPIVAFCSAIRVRDSWWSGPTIKTLARAKAEKNAIKASDGEFWEDVDMLE